MPGFDQCHVIESEIRFRCYICDLIYREPVQNIKTGKCFCKSCVEDTADYRPDNALWKEMKRVDVFCEVCGWKGKLVQLESHWCPRMDVFQENIDLKERLAVQEKTKFMLQQMIAKLEEKIIVLEGTKLNIEDLEPDLPTADTFIIETEKQLPTNNVSKHVEPTPSLDLKTNDFQTIADSLEEAVSELSEEQKKIEETLDEGGMKLALNAKRVEVLSQRSALESELNFSEEKTKGTTVQDCDFSVFSNGAGPPPNGSGMQCRWRIPNVAEALENSKKYPNLPLVSPVWQTQPCGYCVQAYLYFNGHPESVGSFASILMRPVPGAYDGLLKWPLDATLTFCILDLLRKNARPWIKNCRSDPDSPCFKQRPPPPSELSPDMNVASGLPDFIPIHTLLEEFTEDNTIMLEMSLKPKQ